MNPAEIPLRDIHLPTPVGWWPLAPGWWVLFALALVAIVAVLVARRWRRRRVVQKTALNELGTAAAAFRAHADSHRLAREISRLVRRTALALSPDVTMAAATGADWAAHLDTLAERGGSELATLLQDAPYRPNAATDGDALLRAARDWLSSLHPAGARR